jgi:hypothetical protein
MKQMRAWKSEKQMAIPFSTGLLRRQAIIAGLTKNHFSVPKEKGHHHPEPYCF